MKSSHYTLLAVVFGSVLEAQISLAGAPKPHIICPTCPPFIQITALAGGSQTGNISTQLSAPLVIEATSLGPPVNFYSAGTPLPLVGVDLLITSTPTGATGQALSNGFDSGLEVVVLTGGDGTATAQFTLGNMPGTYQVTASCFGCISATFSEVATVCSTGAPCITSPSDGANPQSQFVALSGTGTPGGKLSVIVNGTSVGSVAVDPEGNWEALPYMFSFGPSVMIQVEDQNSILSSNIITVHSQAAYSPGPPVPANLHAAMLPLRKADIFVDADASSPQVTLYGATYTHTALYLGGDSDGTPWIAEAVTAPEAGVWGQVRSIILEESLIWKADRLSAFRPVSPLRLSAATRSSIVSWASSITVQGLPYWSNVDLGLIAVADVLYLAALPQRLNLFLNEIFALKNSTRTFICSTLVWRAYYEGTGHILDISQPNLMTAQPGSILGNFSPGFISLLGSPPVGCSGCGSIFVVPETFVRSPLLTQIF